MQVLFPADRLGAPERSEHASRPSHIAVSDLAVRALVMATGPGPGREPTRDAAVLVDADMSVLGADEARYDEYARAIRDEYAFLAPEAYRGRRAAFLKALLEHERVFNTSWFRERLEARARANVAREIERLAAEGQA